MNRSKKKLALLDSKRDREQFAENNFSFLLAALLILICMMPILRLLGSSRTAFTLLLVFLAGSIILASLTFRANSRLVWTGICFSAIATLLSIIGVVSQSVTIAYSSLLAHTIFWTAGVWIAGSQVLAAGRVTLNRIVGAVCVYLMVAVIFAFLNTLIDWLLPDSFANLTATSLSEKLAEFIYYSFVTLNTLGYGDISPVGLMARVLAIIESTFGVFYMAILVASLVSMHIAHQTVPGENETPSDPPSSENGASSAKD